jgi:hypothetical protein
MLLVPRGTYLSSRTEAVPREVVYQLKTSCSVIRMSA